MKRLDGKVAIVTGASQGMGEAHARNMVLHGAKVVMTDINAEAGGAIAKDIGDDALFCVARCHESRGLAASFGSCRVGFRNGQCIG